MIENQNNIDAIGSANHSPREANDANSEKENKHLQLNSQHKKTLDKIINFGIHCLGYFLISCVMIILIIRALHLILPLNICWLNEVQLSTIDHIILGIISGFTARFWPNNKLHT